MRLRFKNKYMDVGTPEFLWMRATMPICTGGADLAECLTVIEQIDGSDRSWVSEWNKKAEQLQRAANIHLETNQIITAKFELLRASNYYRTAMMRSKAASAEADDLLTKSRESYIQALSHINSSVEFVKIPFGEHLLPAYYYNCGKPDSPTLIGIAGGDSTNEEMFNLLGFAAIEREWNCLVYEGPGQYTARQLNPNLHLMHNWEAPNGAIVDWLNNRPEVAKDKIALFGWSLSSNLAIRAAAFDKRIAAVVSNGLIVDVYQAWYGVWPKWLQRAKPKYFDFFFHILEKLSSQVRAIASVFYQMHGVTTPTKMIQAWKPFNVSDCADKVECPTLFITGEAEYAEQSAGPLILSIGNFLKNIKAPSWFHEFGFESGWAASHCQIGAQQKLQELTFDWLEMVLIHPDKLQEGRQKDHDFSKVISYFNKTPGLETILNEVKIKSF
ncbi:MAG: alpha/beta hydrolase [Bacteroidetes bacterium]|nr:alpha/beta hydrolase [Bacteroidota bacterium]